MEAKRMVASFGAPFLWLVTLIYFTQGFRSFVWTAVSYQMKDMLKLTPSASQFVVSIAHFPWSVKPIYGILSDCFPIKGMRRVPYLVIAAVLSLFPWLILGFMASVRSSQNLLTAFLTLQSLGSAMADVVVDAMIAEAVRSERAEFAGDLQSLSWFAMALGGICGSLLGGYTMSHLRLDTVFLLFSVLPAMQLISSTLVKENPAGLKRVQNNNKKEIRFSEDNDSSTTGTFRKESGTYLSRKKNHKPIKGKVKSTNREVLKKQNGSEVATYYSSLKFAVFSLFQAFRQPIILRPMAWFFLSHIAVPNLSTVMFYYQSEVLHLDASFLGTTRVMGWFGLMVGTYLYNRYLKQMKLRRILMFSHIGLAITSLLDIVLVSGSHTQLAIPDKYMVLWGSTFGDAINQFKMMPFLILSGQLCPPGIEGTLFALFMSINNLGSTLGSFSGAALASVLGISSESFKNLTYGLALQVSANLFPIAFLFLIPKDTAGHQKSA